MEKIAVGLDIGTSSLKTMLYSSEQGVLSRYRNTYSQQTNNPQLLSENIMNTLEKTLDGAFDKEPEVIGIASFFPTLMALDKDYKPLTEIMMWSDNRADAIVNDALQSGIRFHTKTGCPEHPSYSLWKIAWLKKHQPDNFQKAHYFVSYPDYLYSQMTGYLVTSKSLASATGMYNHITQAWDKEILQFLDIKEGQLPAIVESSAIFPLKKEFWKQTKNQPLVNVPMGDGLLCHLGSGCMRPDIMSSTIGTSGALRLLSSQQIISDSVWSYHFESNKYIHGMAINAGLSTPDWLKKIVLAPSEEISYGQFGGPVFLPFLGGERGPGYNATAKASFIGITAKDTASTMLISAMEGVFFNLYTCYEKLLESHPEPLEIRASGGYVNQPAMLQMQADIFNKVIIVPEEPEATVLGAATMALKSAGFATGNSHLSRLGEKRFSPRKEINWHAMQRYRKYKEFYKAIIDS